MDVKKIEITVDVYAAIESRRTSFDQTHNDILREILKLGRAVSEQSPKKTNAERFWTTKNVDFLIGAKLQAHYKGRAFEAEVVPGGLKVNNKVYQSPSAAAFAITIKNVNGWRFWKYYDNQLNAWRLIDELRR